MPGSLVVVTVSAPSSSLGRNSVPRLEPTRMAATSSTTAAPMVMPGCAWFSPAPGHRRAARPATILLSCSATLPLSRKLASTGISVRLSTSEASSAKITVSAIGRNILPSSALQAEDRQYTAVMMIDREGDRAGDLERRLAHHLRRRPVGQLGAAAHHVLDHHHRAVDQQAEIDGAEAHQIARQAGAIHGDGGGEHRERDGAGDDEAGAQIAEQQEQHER